jgi:hypothetical protein
MDEVLLKMILFLSAFGLFIYLINTGLRKWLKVEKKKLFSYNHINEKHKKIDWMIRVFSITLIIAGFIVHLLLDPVQRIWFLETHYILFGFLIASETARAIFEKKYSSNQNDYIYTTIQMVYLSVLLLSAFMTDFYGLF